MTSTPITPEEAEAIEAHKAQFGLPIDHLMTVDPLDITEPDLLLIITHFRHSRFNHLKAMEKPKAVEKNRNPKLDAEATQKEINNLMADLGFDD